MWTLGILPSLQNLKSVSCSKVQVALSASHKVPFLNICRNNTGCVYPSAHVLTLDEWNTPDGARTVHGVQDTQTYSTHWLGTLWKAEHFSSPVFTGTVRYSVGSDSLP